MRPQNPCFLCRATLYAVSDLRRLSDEDITRRSLDTDFVAAEPNAKYFSAGCRGGRMVVLCASSDLKQRIDEHTTLIDGNS